MTTASPVMVMGLLRPGHLSCEHVYSVLLSTHVDGGGGEGGGGGLKSCIVIIYLSVT